MKLDVIAVTYHQNEPLKGFINAFKSQTSPDWNLYIIHDGEDDEYHKIKQDLTDNDYLSQPNIILDHSPQKGANPWGHECRDYGMKKYIKSDSNILVHTNADNYYVPIFTQYLLDSFGMNPGLTFFYWNCIHSHENPANPKFYPAGAGSYSLLETELQHSYIDMGCVAVKNDIAKKVGFKHTEQAADWYYFNDLIDRMNEKDNNKIIKSKKILLVHN